MSYEEFLELPENDRFEYLTNIKLNWWQRMYIKLLNKWWTFWRNEHPDLKAIVLWESIYKGRL